MNRRPMRGSCLGKRRAFVFWAVRPGARALSCGDVDTDDIFSPTTQHALRSIIPHSLTGRLRHLSRKTAQQRQAVVHDGTQIVRHTGTTFRFHSKSMPHKFDDLNKPSRTSPIMQDSATVIAIQYRPPVPRDPCTPGAWNVPRQRVVISTCL